MYEPVNLQLSVSCVHGAGFLPVARLPLHHTADAFQQPPLHFHAAGKAYKAAHQQLQQHLTAYPVQGQAAPQGIQMAAYPPQPGMYGAPGAHMGAPGPAQPMQQQQQQQWGPPPGYPTSPPQAGGAPTGQHAV
jgi:hypothetical protein